MFATGEFPMIFKSADSPSRPLLLYERRKVEQIVLAMEDSLNFQIIRLLAMNDVEDYRRFLRGSIKRSFRHLSLLRFRGSHNSPSAEWLRTLLFDQPFDGVEHSNILSLVSLLIEEGWQRNTVTDDEVVLKFKEFYKVICVRLSAGDPGNDLIDLL